jgi:O-acetyl-ADP-ribose deacetylase (regulator of RNase III)/DNA-binding XRE family transcriptional regulator
MSNVKFITGNLFTSGCQTIVNTVNCVGVMGAGIALEFKYRYPEMYERYVELCKKKHIQIGKLWLYNKEPNRKWVLNFPTKKDWKFDSKQEYIEKGLKKFLETYREKEIKSIAFPLLGANKGGLDPSLSKDIMTNYLSQCDIPVEIYQFDPEAKDDLIDLAREIFENGIKSKSLKEYGINSRTFNKVKKAIQENKVNSMNQLRRVKGIGETTMEKCYKFLILYKQSTQHVFTPDLFSSANVNDNVKKEPIKNYENLSVNEIANITGLNKETIIKIETTKDDVTIGEIRSYCKKLNLDPLEVLANYFQSLKQEA